LLEELSLLINDDRADVEEVVTAAPDESVTGKKIAATKGIIAHASRAAILLEIQS
jgi:hypothetical protein